MNVHQFEYNRRVTTLKNRYGLPKPQKPLQRHRLYLEGEFSTLDWLHAVDFFRGCCAYCGVPFDNSRVPDVLTLDLFLPAVRGGRLEPGNVLPSCYACNQNKHERLALSFMMRLYTGGMERYRALYAFLMARRQEGSYQKVEGSLQDFHL